LFKLERLIHKISAPLSRRERTSEPFSTTEAGEVVEKGEEGFFYSLPTFLYNLIRKGSDAPFSLGNDVRAVFHHRAHRDHREGALVRVLGKEVWMRILIATNFLKKRAESMCYRREKLINARDCS
jgi:hypothetical protein